jgi:hypothetical protein
MITGDKDFGISFSCMEQSGYIRHLRVSNEDDPVCYFPPIDGYVPSGMQLTLLLNKNNGHGHGHVLWHPTITNPQKKSFSAALQVVDIDDNDDDYNDESKKYEIAFVDRDNDDNVNDNDDNYNVLSSLWDNLIRALKISISRDYGTDLFRNHMVPSYLKRLEREKEILSSITIKDLYREVKRRRNDDDGDE